jgi:hypothetical protein
MTKADLWNVFTALDNYKYYIENYPETVSARDEDDLKIALQIIEDKLYGD